MDSREETESKDIFGIREAACSASESTETCLEAGNLSPPYRPLIFESFLLAVSSWVSVATKGLFFERVWVVRGSTLATSY